jgi:hypothetical protein
MASSQSSSSSSFSQKHPVLHSRRPSGAKAQRRVKPQLVSREEPLQGAPFINADGVLEMTVLPDPFETSKKLEAKRMKRAAKAAMKLQLNLGDVYASDHPPTHCSPVYVPITTNAAFIPSLSEDQTLPFPEDVPELEQGDMIEEEDLTRGSKKKKRKKSSSASNTVQPMSGGGLGDVDATFQAALELGSSEFKEAVLLRSYTQDQAPPQIAVNSVTSEVDSEDSEDSQEPEVVESPKKKRKTQPVPKQAAVPVQGPEGFAGLKGWTAIGGLQETYDLLVEKKLSDGSWVQYTRDPSTFIPATRYKQLLTQANHTNTPLAELIQTEKDSLLSKGRRKVICSVRLGVGADSGELQFSSIPPKGERASPNFPNQLRTWTLKASAEGNTVVYKKTFA